MQRFNQGARRRPSRGGVALLMCLFVIFMVSVWLTDMLTTQTAHMAAIRNTVEYQQALYLANAGVHHAAAELEANIAASKQIQKDEIEYLRRAIELAMSNPSATLADIHKDPQIKSLAAKLPNPKTRGT